MAFGQLKLKMSFAQKVAWTLAQEGVAVKFRIEGT